MDMRKLAVWLGLFLILGWAWIGVKACRAEVLIVSSSPRCDFCGPDCQCGSVCKCDVSHSVLLPRVTVRPNASTLSDAQLAARLAEVRATSKAKNAEVLARLYTGVAASVAPVDRRLRAAAPTYNDHFVDANKMVSQNGRYVTQCSDGQCRKVWVESRPVSQQPAAKSRTGQSACQSCGPQVQVQGRKWRLFR